MNKEILLVVDAVSNERGVNKSLIFEALEAALASAVRKRYGNDIEVRVVIDRVTGDYQTLRRWQIVEDPVDCGLEYPKRQISLSAAVMLEPESVVGGYIEEPMESAAFDRIAAQTAKQVIVQKVREAERAKILSAFQDRKGELITGIVKRIERGDVIIDLGSNVEAIIPKEHTIKHDANRIGDRVRGYLCEVRPEISKGPQLIASRTAPEFLIELFKLEVPEVGEGLIKICGAARDPGGRSKIAVHACEPRIDPIGACVGMCGSRVQAVSSELNGEHVDIVLWDEYPARFIMNAMAPAEALSIVIYEETHSADVVVNEAKSSQAIGRYGVNVRLASQLTGWIINVIDEAEASKKVESEKRELVELFRSQLNIDAECANILVEKGYSTLDEIAYLPVAEMLEIEEFDEPLVEKLRQNAKDAVLNRAIALEEISVIAPELLTIEGMDVTLATKLISNNLLTLEAVAEQSVEDLMGIKGMDKERAAMVIMKARAPWFANMQEK
ncbi:transcription elongation factor NusA [Achromatium sp. WMS2]|nr:transcription elongation factor NusA [Achromatium sp. WMS2]